MNRISSSKADAIIRVKTKENPKRPNTYAWNQYDVLSKCDGKTVAEYRQFARSAHDQDPSRFQKWPWDYGELTYCIDKGFVSLEGGTDSIVDGPDSIQSSLEEILSSYVEISQNEPYGQLPELWAHFETIQSCLEQASTVRSRSSLQVSWSVGRGNWARVPWIVLLDQRETRSTQEGVYCPFLFRSDMTGVYLTFSQGVTEPKKRLGPAGGLAEVRAKAERLRSIASPLIEQGFSLDDEIDLRIGAGLGSDYESSTIAYKLYERASVPDDQSILEDIEAILCVYDAYLKTSPRITTSNPGLEAMRERFLSRMQDFDDFPSARPESIYRREERDYKVELTTLFQEKLATQLSAPAGTDETEELLCDAVHQFLRHRLSSIGASQNLITWRDFIFFQKFDGPAKREFVAMLRDLLYSENEVGKRIEEFNRRAATLFARLGLDFIPAWSRLLPTSFLMIAFPKEEVFVKTHQFNRTAKEVMGWPSLETKPFDAEQYERMKQLAHVVRQALEDWGWEPQDMLDVQSFIWVAQSRQAHDQDQDTERQTDQNSSEFEVTSYVPPSFDQIREHVIETEGIRISERLLRQYHVALEARGFVILSGISGSGKTWLTEAYANAVGARYLLVPVAPNWTTNEDLLGFYNPLDGVYHHTVFSKFLEDAGQAYQAAVDQGVAPQPYHLVLDEMNLARVEYYFAKFLSAMELRFRKGTSPIELGPANTLQLTPNLRFVGTVNVDETTHGFADKVYDRAQLIELDAPRHLIVEHLGDTDFASALVEVWDCVSETAPFGFRIIDDVQNYVSRCRELNVAWQEALDEQILQKVLPKIKGAEPPVGVALQQLVELTADQFPLTHRKATEMLNRFQQHGFTSYF